MILMKRILVSLILAFIGLMPVAAAEEPVLVELFASQNCRVCPKAHKVLKALDAEHDDVLILTWSVDYWDYLGDKDPMAMVESKERQRGYVDRFHLRGPYTPQTVYDGVEQCVGSKRSYVKKALEKASERPDTDVKLTVKGDKILLSGTAPGLTDIWLVDYLSGAANTTNMVHPVTRVSALGPWLGNDVQLNKPHCESGCAIIVQEAGFGPVLETLVVKP
ncbi:hypothetical protein HY29_10510 [Hyphomonas beringensis]|uniref:DUF1223 domain-containing protein n=1 Tax=Hyphomonas beringensis TaxID=1280946 RepID=A0A062UGU1_9PROT|nr:DUF1223 domain-containing protein [Hyphomonas beringensis]KCZ55789.1 hypothetical protein HY29_10510 [Hyphomonas beringensis]